VKNKWCTAPIKVKATVSASAVAGSRSSFFGLRHGEAWRRGAEVLAASGLGDVAGTRAGRLSGGMRRRLDLALALVKRPGGAVPR
jgi:ABC-type multidrug transport system ATPase subunit